MIGLGHKHWNDREGRRFAFVSLIDLARLNKVFVALNCMLISDNEKVGRALYLIPLRRSVVELYSPATAIQIPLQWKYCNLLIRSTILGINSGLVGQGSQPLIDKSLVHNGPMKGLMQL